MINDRDIANILEKTSVFIEKSSILIDKVTTDSSTGFTTTLWVAGGVIIAALITREIKISEFRQAWINDLREDISEYISKADEWMDVYLVNNEDSSQDKKAKAVEELNKLKYASIKTLRRIKMRFKLDDKKANKLISNLEDLLAPSKLAHNMSKSDWSCLADNAVSEARNILKEEWDVTKNPLKKIYLTVKNKFLTKKSS